MIQNFINECLDYYINVISGNKNYQNPITKWENNLKKLEYSEPLGIIEDIIKEIEEIYNEKKKSEQIRLCAEFILKLKKDEEGNEKKNRKYEFAEKIIQKLFIESLWNEKEIKIYKILTDWLDIFLSYTNREAHTINISYEILLKHALNEDIYELYKNKPFNLIAYYISKCFKSNNLRCFYDKDILKYGDDLKNKIFDYCKKSLSFVQLISYETFSKPIEKEKNWCYEEYKEFKNSIFNNFFFIILEGKESIRQPKRYDKYEEWIEDCVKHKYCELEETISLKKFRQKIQDLSNIIFNKTEETKNKLLKTI